MSSPRKLNDKDLLVVQLNDSVSYGSNNEEIVSVSFETLKDSTVHIAYAGAEDPANDTIDAAGTVFPGKGFYYDPNTGRMDVKIDSDLEFQGVILRDDSVSPNADGLYPSWGQTIWRKGNDPATGEPYTKRGNFWVVGSPDMYLSSVWHLEPGVDSVTSLGDIVVCTNDSTGGTGSRDTHLWNVIPNITGAQAVLEVQSHKPSVDETQDANKSLFINTSGPSGSPQRPVVTVREAGQISSGANQGEWRGGLLSDSLAEKLGQLNKDLLEEGFVIDLYIKGDEVSQDALYYDTVGSSMDPREQFHYVNLGINQSTETVYGVIELASQAQVDHVIDASTPGADPLRTDESAMTPRTTIDNFVPRRFNTLPTLQSIN